STSFPSEVRASRRSHVVDPGRVRRGCDHGLARRRLLLANDWIRPDRQSGAAQSPVPTVSARSVPFAFVPYAGADRGPGDADYWGRWDAAGGGGDRADADHGQVADCGRHGGVDVLDELAIGLAGHRGAPAFLAAHRHALAPNSRSGQEAAAT